MCFELCMVCCFVLVCFVCCVGFYCSVVFRVSIWYGNECVVCLVGFYVGIAVFVVA